MRAISLHQPWASLVSVGAKKWETRGRQIHHRGFLAIHAAQTRKPMDQWRGEMPFVETLRIHRFDTRQDLPLGAVVALVVVKDVITATEWIRRHCRTPMDKANELEFLFGNYEPGRFAWQLGEVRRLREPLPMKGRQFIWTPTIAEQEEILRRVA